MNPKRVIVSTIFLLVITGCILGVFAIFSGILNDEITRRKAEPKQITLATESINSMHYDIMVWGNSFVAPEGLQYRYIDALDSESLAYAPDHEGHILILYDYDGDLIITSRQFDKIRSLMMDDHYIILYVGEKYLSTLQDHGMFFENYPDDTRSVGFFDDGVILDLGIGDSAKIEAEMTPEEKKAMDTETLFIELNKHLVV